MSIDVKYYNKNAAIADIAKSSDAKTVAIAKYLKELEVHKTVTELIKKAFSFVIDMFTC